MRVISRMALREFWDRHTDAESGLGDWYKTARQARWKNIVGVRRYAPNADAVKVGSGNTVTVFNIAGNKYRLVTAIHYNTGIVYILRVMTHAEYSKDRWKDEL